MPSGIAKGFIWTKRIYRAWVSSKVPPREPSTVALHGGYKGKSGGFMLLFSDLEFRVPGCFSGGLRNCYCQL